MPRMPRSARVFLLALALAPPALAESDYERGYREGYSRGFQDSQTRQPLMAAPHRGRPGIVVVRAWYGNHQRSCDLTAWAAGRFNNRTHGEVDVSNGLCGDVAPGQRKSLEVEYYCQGELKTASAFEHRKLDIRCP